LSVRPSVCLSPIPAQMQRRIAMPVGALVMLATARCDTAHVTVQCWRQEFIVTTVVAIHLLITDTTVQSCWGALVEYVNEWTHLVSAKILRWKERQSTNSVHKHFPISVQQDVFWAESKVNSLTIGLRDWLKGKNLVRGNRNPRTRFATSDTSVSQCFYPGTIISYQRQTEMLHNAAKTAKTMAISVANCACSHRHCWLG